MLTIKHNWVFISDNHIVYPYVLYILFHVMICDDLIGLGPVTVYDYFHFETIIRRNDFMPV